MSKADSLRLRDVRSVYRLIGECHDLGRNVALWHRRMLEGLSRLFEVIQAAGGEAWWDRPSHAVEPISVYSVSEEPGPDEVLRAYHRDGGPGNDPIFHAIQKLPDKLVTRTRRQLVPDIVWYRSASWGQYRRAAGIDHSLVSVFRISDDGATSVIALNREFGDRDFSPREQRLLNFFHAEIGRLIRGPLASDTEPGFDQLAPRLRQTLACLLDGNSEKQVAVRLGLSPATVHQYVTALYRRFGVRSRAQLLAYVLKRMMGAHLGSGGLDLRSAARRESPGDDVTSPRVQNS
jgi:DNA-binding CsgD family transcriptional regulator